MFIYIKDVKYQIDEGASDSLCYNETLDSGEIRISHLTSPLEIEPYDKVILQTDISERTMLIDTYEENLECINPKTYSYTIKLFSETKELETVILPNRSITQLKSNKRSISYYLTHFIQQYSPQYRGDDGYTHYRWMLDYDTSVRFNRIECPEFQWNSPTLREVLNDLMMVDDCIPVLRDGVIYCIDLTEKKKDISNLEQINYIRKSQSSEDYISEIKMNLQNAIQSESNGVNNCVSFKETLPFTSDNGYIVNEENIVFKTKYPILRIKHLWFSFWTYCQEGYVYIKKDLCNLKGSNDDEFYNIVKENKEYATLSILNRISDIEIDSDNCPKYAKDIANYQNLCVEYTRGGNTITNWNSNIKTWWFFTDSYLELLIKFLCKYCTPDGVTNIQFGKSDSNNYYRPLIEVEYETTASQVFSAGKSNVVKNKRTIIDNQTNSWVDAYNQGNLEYQKANRLGNQQILINARFEFDEYDDIIKIGDYYEDYIVYQVSYQHYINHIDVNAIACRDYILRDYYTGIKSKIRTWKNAQDEAFERHELIKYYLEFSEKSKEEYGDKIINNLKYFLAPINYSQTVYNRVNPVSLIKTNKMVPTLSGNRAYVIEQLKKIAGNSIVYTLGFNDNSVFRVANNIQSSNLNEVPSSQRKIPCVKSSYTDDYGGIPLQPYKYTDENLEFTTVSIYLDLPESDVYNRTFDGYIREIYPASELIQQLNKTDFTRVIGTEMVAIEYLSVRKDNREIPVFSIQFEFCSDTKNIVFTRKFLEYQRAIRDEPFDARNIKIYEGDMNDFNYIKPSLDNANLMSSANISVTNIISGKTEEIIINNVDANKAYYITDENNNIILATNGIYEFYLNFLKDRDINIYDSEGNTTGTIIS